MGSLDGPLINAGPDCGNDPKNEVEITEARNNVMEESQNLVTD